MVMVQLLLWFIVAAMLPVSILAAVLLYLGWRVRK